jgi:formate dehydrogenase maturation protein FdhE
MVIMGIEPSAPSPICPSCAGESVHKVVKLRGEGSTIEGHIVERCSACKHEWAELP